MFNSIYNSVYGPLDNINIGCMVHHDSQQDFYLLTGYQVMRIATTFRNQMP
jgi:hypothetical protein